MRRRFLLAAPALLATPAGAAEDQLTRLMHALAAVPSRRAVFTEQRSLPELDVPLSAEGTLAWTAPATLEKHTTTPFEERIAVTGGRLLYERPDRGISQEISLDEQPEIQALVEAIRGTLAGDLAALRRHYRVAFQGQAESDWRMILLPLASRVREAVQRVLLSGQGATVTGVDTEGNGNVTHMRIRPAP